ncbi:hypothetical protein OF83DRAFT_1124349 [Amylostereum chailletii]|nr:hypothetical protein OF83DRAFT_1124349 [Amylostereum chailletii]
MRYYIDAPRNADLGHGYDRWIRRPDERGRLDSLLKAYSKVRAEAPPAAGNLSAGVMSWRGVMTSEDIDRPIRGTRRLGDERYAGRRHFVS